MNLDSFFVGVTGHRSFIELADPLFLNSLDSMLARLESIHPGTKPTLLSGLATGADTMVAMRALAKGWLLHAVLAKPLPHYYSDFDTDADRAQLDFLVSLSEKVLEVSTPDVGDPQCYVNVGEFIIKNVHQLLAVWDGELENPKPGGTAWVVTHFLERHALNKNNLHILRVRR